MLRQQPGQKVFTVPGPDWGVRVVQPAAAAADWWDPNNAGLSVIGAYRAINSIGTPWPGGPANYAESLINQANPGVNDLVEGNGAVPWAAATGWGFVAVALQYFDTGIMPGAAWTLLCEFSGVAVAGNEVLTGCYTAPNTTFHVCPDDPAGGGANVRYGHGSALAVAPAMVAGNLAHAGQNAYRNGVPDGVIPIGGIPALNVYIGAINFVGAAWLFITANIHAIAMYDATLTAPQVLAVATAMAAL